MRCTSILAGMTALLFTLPATAQQATPQPPAPSGATAPRAPATGPMSGPGMMGGPGMGQGMMGQGMGMMRGPGMRDADDDDDDDRGGPMRGWGRGSGGRGAPTQIIINIGPNNRVEVEERGSRGFPGAGAGPMGRQMMTEQVETHLNSLRGELQLRPEQQPAWDRFASTVREAAGQMRASPAAMAQSQGLEQHLTAHEAMLSSRLEAIRSVRGAVSGLTEALDESQRRALDEHAARFMPGMGRMRGGMR